MKAIELREETIKAKLEQLNNAMALNMAKDATNHSQHKNIEFMTELELANSARLLALALEELGKASRDMDKRSSVNLSVKSLSV